jgi:Ca-activated chloride channel family protein
MIGSRRVALALVAATLTGALAVGATPAGAGGCAIVDIASSPEKLTLLTELAERFNQSDDARVDGQCVTVRVQRVSSGAGETLLRADWPRPAKNGPRPAIWSPAASTWAGVLDQHRADLGKEPYVTTPGKSFMLTPLVIAMPEPMAEALGYPDTPLGFEDVLALATDPAGWAGKGHPEWGPFRFGKTNPNFSTSGLHATVGTFFAATGVASDLTVAQVQNRAAAEYVRRLESSVVHYGDTTLTFLDTLLAADREGQGLTYVSAVTVEEKSVLDYNAGNPAADPEATDLTPPRTPLVAVYPKEGTLLSDSPWAILQAEWVDESRAAVAEDLLAWFLEDDQQQRFAEAGFRTADGRTGPLATPDNGILADQPSAVLGTPNAEVLAAVRDAWEDYRKPARVLLVMDVSGSMGAPVEGTGSNRLELAQQATIGALDDFAAQDALGLWVFSSEEAQGGADPWSELVPVGPRDEVIERVESMVAGLVPDGGTALYATTKAAQAEMEAAAEPGAINAVVLLSDGVNEHSDSDLDAVLHQLETEGTATGVRVFVIGYGEDADQETLEQIASASRARAYNASDAATIDKVMVDVISNF